MIEARRIKVPQWIRGARCVIRVDVEAVLPPDDPSEPCFEPATVRWMDELQELADAGRGEKLAKVGEVYVRQSA